MSLLLGAFTCLNASKWSDASDPVPVRVKGVSWDCTDIIVRADIHTCTSYWCQTKCDFTSTNRSYLEQNGKSKSINSPFFTFGKSCLYIKFLLVCCC